MLNEIYDKQEESKASFTALVESASSEILKKERSAQASTQLLQTRQADVEQQLAVVTQQLQELTGLMGQSTPTASATSRCWIRWRAA